MPSINSNQTHIIDCQNRFIQWEKDVIDIIKNLASNENVLKKQFVAAHVSGVYFASSYGEAHYATSELCFVKFNFESGIKETLTLFPDAVQVPTGYRESLYEDLDEAVGWRPDTFRTNHSIPECCRLIKDFFKGNYSPLFTLDHLLRDELTMALYFLYADINERCPWIHSLEDRGRHCTIYLLDRLTADIISQNNSDKLSMGDVRNHCNQMNQNIASETCERHDENGLANQCAKAIVVKNLYSTFLLMFTVFKDKMSDIQDMVSKDYFASLDFILSTEEVNNKETDYWNHNTFDDANVEDVAERFGAISVKENRRTIDYASDRVSMGRGQPLTKDQFYARYPGEVVQTKKLKLPNVIC